MRNVCFKKVLVVGIFVLFIGVSYTSLGVEVNKNIEIESEEDSEIETLDYYDEIITFIQCIEPSQ